MPPGPSPHPAKPKKRGRGNPSTPSPFKSPERPPRRGTPGRLRPGAVSLDAVLAVEALDPTRRVQELLFPGEERVARRADLDVDGGHGGAGLDDIAAGADDAGRVVLRMDPFLHGSSHHNTRVRRAQRRAGGNGPPAGRCRSLPSTFVVWLCSPVVAHQGGAACDFS